MAGNWNIITLKNIIVSAITRKVNAAICIALSVALIRFSVPTDRISMKIIFN